MKYILLILFWSCFASCSTSPKKSSNRSPKTGKIDTDDVKNDQRPLSGTIKDGKEDDGQKDGQEEENDEKSETLIDKIIKYSKIAKLVNEKCGVCHKPGGARSFSDLTSFDGLKEYALKVAEKVESGHNANITLLSTSEKELLVSLKVFALENDLEEKESNDSDNEVESQIVEFRIEEGTGSSAWNSISEPLKLKVGQTLRIYNDDDEVHALHTNGAPCSHGDDIQPGEYWDCKLESKFRGGKLYDHYNQLDGFFYFSVEP